jgi:hypothetical protein
MGMENVFNIHDVEGIPGQMETPNFGWLLQLIGKGCLVFDIPEAATL